MKLKQEIDRLENLLAMYAALGIWNWWPEYRQTREQILKLKMEL